MQGTFRPMELTYFDLPMLHLHTEEGMDFMEALKENGSIEIFGKSSVQILVDEQWDRWNFFNNWFRMIPIVLQLITFWLWSNVLLPNIDNEGLAITSLVCEIIILVVSSYLLAIEVIEIIISGPVAYVANS